MKQLAIRNIALIAGAILILACGGATTPRTNLDRKFYLINAVKGSTLISANLREGLISSYELARDVPLGGISAVKSIDLSDLDHYAVLFGGGYNATTTTARTQAINVVVAMSPDSGPISEYFPLVPRVIPSLVFFKDGNFGGASSLDVYITDPGASITSATPAGTITDNGKSYVFNGLFGPTRPFEVRLTRAGTKDVVINLGSSTALTDYQYRFYTLYHNGTTEQFRTFDFTTGSL